MRYRPKADALGNCNPSALHLECDGEIRLCGLALPVDAQVQVTFELMFARVMPEGVLNVDSVVKVCALRHRALEVDWISKTCCTGFE